jgi:glycosyltransferase involved in cell wall biosynthesis
MRVRNRVRADLHAAVCELGEGVPLQRPDVGLRRLACVGGRQHWKRQPPLRKRGAGEDRGRDAEPVESGKRIENAAVRVVERDVQQAAAPGDDVGGRDGTVPPAEQEPDLSLERLRRDGEPVLPPLRNRVVAEDNRLEPPAHRRDCGVRCRASVPPRALFRVVAGPGEKRLRVLMLVDNLLPGGAERVAATLAILLDRSRFRPTVCVSRAIEGPSPLIDDLGRADVPILPLTRTSRRAIGAWRPLITFLRRERVDILHAHKFGSNVWGAALATLARVPVFVAHEQGSTFLGQRLRPFLDRELIARAADALIVVSPEDERTMVDVARIAPGKVRLVRNGIVPPLPSGRDVRAELGIPPDAELVGTVAVLRPEKALGVLIDATALLAPEFPRLRVLIAGGGPEEDRLRAIVRDRGLEDRVLLLGLRRDVADVLSVLDVVAFSSDREGTPLAVMEAMAAAKPIVATRVGGIPDLVEDGVHGLLVPRRDPGALADSLARLLRDGRLRTELGRRGQERQRREFDIGVTVRHVESLYEELIALRRAR